MGRRVVVAAGLLFVVACSKDRPPVPAAVEAEAPPPAPVEAAAPPEPTAVLREEKTLDVDGVKETWRLEWIRPPVPTCMGDEGLASCPCAPFGFGEVGDLDLVRARPGEPDDRLHLDPLFEDHDAKLRRWAPTAAEQKALKAPPIADLQARELAPLMVFGDYDHDGRATEFVLAVAAPACGHVQSVVVGIDKRNPKLHAFGTADKPGEPLVLERTSDWEKVKGKLPVELTEWTCGDHGAEVETHVTISLDLSGLRATPTSKKCN
jgi:hypothetical protein